MTLAYTKILLLSGPTASVEADLAAMISAGWTILPTDISSFGMSSVHFIGLATKLEPPPKARKRSATSKD